MEIYRQKQIHYEKSNLSTNDHGCIELDEMSYLFHIVIGKNAAPSVDYVGSFKLICQLTSHDHYRLRAQHWLYFFHLQLWIFVTDHQNLQKLNDFIVF